MDTIRSTYSRKRASLGMLSLNQIHYTSPWVAMAWSFFFPGFGHILLGEYIQGWVLFLWELFVNVHAHFNVAIMLALTGRFNESIQELSAGGTYWILLYGTVFCYALFASYRLAVETNQLFTLAMEEDIPIEIFKINALQFNFFNKRSPWVAAIWSLLMPGLGGMCNRKMTSSVFALGWWIAIVYFSHMLPSTEYTLTGRFHQATTILNVEWILFLPSMYGFAFYNAYVSMVAQNEVFAKQQSKFLKTIYQRSCFPFQVEGQSQVRIVATFEHSLMLEQAIVSIQRRGVSRDSVYAIPLANTNECDFAPLDFIHRSDESSLLDIPAIVAALFCALGTIYGFVLQGGPVLWGLIGFSSGLILGVIIKVTMIKRMASKRKKRSKTEVVLMIDCEEALARQVVQILWHHQAFGVARIG